MARRRWMALMTVVAAASACGGGGTRSASSTSTSTTVIDAPTSTSAPSSTSARPTTRATTRNTATTRLPATTTAPAGALALSDGDSGRTVTVHRGDSVTVVLHSTYWSLLAPSNAAVVQPQGSPVTAPIPPPACVPGGGCGTVTARYRAVAPGSAQLAAHRDSCGEAMACGPGQGEWRVTITVV